jgi:hypothetical protein
MKLLILIALLTAKASSEELIDFQAIQSPLASPTYDTSPVRAFVPNTPQRSPRVTGGQQATLGQIPYQVLLYTSPVGNPRATYLCGASIISTTWLLTAGHCVYEMENATVFVGVVDRVKGPAAWRAKLDRSALLTHPRYNENEISNDIGLIRTPAIPLSANVAAIALPDSSPVTLTYREALIAGWGSVRSPTQFLQVATATITAGGTCSIYFGVLNFRYSNLCVGTVEGGSPCSG